MCSNSAIGRPLPVRVWKKLLHPQSCSLMAPPWQGLKHENTPMDAPSNKWGWSSCSWIPLLALGLMLLLPCSDVVSISYSRKALCISLRAFISPLLGCRFYRNLPWLYSSMRWKKHSSLEKQMYNSPNFRNYCWNSACAQFRESKTLGLWCLHVSQVPELPFQSMKIQSIEPALFNSVKKKGELNALWMSVTIRTVSQNSSYNSQVYMPCQFCRLSAPGWLLSAESPGTALLLCSDEDVFLPSPAGHITWWYACKGAFQSPSHHPSLWHFKIFIRFFFFKVGYCSLSYIIWIDFFLRQNKINQIFCLIKLIKKQ